MVKSVEVCNFFTQLSEETVSKRSTGSLSPDVGSKYKVGDLLKFVHSIQVSQCVWRGVCGRVCGGEGLSVCVWACVEGRG